MNRRHVAMFLLLAPLAAGGSRAADESTFDPAAATNAFGVDLYRQLHAEGSNLFFSPASIAGALSMTSLGARGATADEMDRVLHLSGDDAGVAAAFGDLMTTLTAANDHATLNVANRLYGQHDFGFSPAFLGLLKRHYGAGLEEVDFRTDPDAARRNINTWVEQQTAQKIRNLLVPGALHAGTRLVLVNAIHFLGTWQQPFAVDATTDAPFHRERGGDVTAPFMHVTGRFGYAEDGDVQILALPYKGGALEMVLILPAEGTSLSSVEAGLDAGKFAGWLAAPAPARVAVGLPRLHLETAFDLAGTLAALGMPTAFTAAADFSGLTTSGAPLNIDKVVHKAYLDVDEKGTEAAAATAVTMEVTSARPVEKLKVFTADRPFILAIRHQASGAVLFLGRVADPS
jgi:serpin B